MDRIILQDQLVANVFPTAIRNRLYDGMGKSGRTGGNVVDPFGNEGEAGKVTSIAPMADLFPNTTIIFADIVGFTAWSSAREPQQVFTLLETIYAAFHRVAYRHNVFKVETVGDCYVAATGVPEPMEDHAGGFQCRNQSIL
jgi:class 3 adenylate cyclase